MRLLVHRGQVLLLLIVGVLAGVAVAGVCLELCGVSVLGILRVNELFVQPRSELPSQIVIAAAAAPTAPGVPGLPPSTTVAAGAVQPDQPRATPTAAVVPGAVYTWPPDSGGGGGGRGGGGGSGSGRGHSG